MEKQSIALNFSFNNTPYAGWATPSDERHKDGSVKSYHVVLNEVFFGNMSIDHDKWIVSEQRPQELVQATGHCLAEAIDRDN